MVEWLALLTLDHKILGLNPAVWWNSAHDCMVLHCTEPFIITLPSSQYIYIFELRLLEKPIEPSVVHSSMNAMDHAK